MRGVSALSARFAKPADEADVTLASMPMRRTWARYGLEKGHGIRVASAFTAFCRRSQIQMQRGGEAPKAGGGGNSESAMLVGDDIMTRAPNRQLKYQLQCLGRPV